MLDLSLRDVLYVLAIVLTFLLFIGGMEAVRYLLNKVPFVQDFEIPKLAVPLRSPFRFLILVVGLQITWTWINPTDFRWEAGVDQTLRIAMIAAITWIAIAFVGALEAAIVDRYTNVDDPEDATVRRGITQISLLRRLVVAFIVIIAVAIVLMTFTGFRAIGTGLLASAGLLSVVVGIAAQSTLGNVFAGLHIAFGNTVKVNDIVVVAGETGQIDEVTLTTVVVNIWNDRRLILPTSFFKEQPFENWTRNGPRIAANIFFDVAFTAPVAEMRAELERYLPTHPQWDGRNGVLWVSDISGGRMRLRIAVSTANTDNLWVLLNDVREHMVSYLVQTDPASLLQFRGEGVYPA